MGRLLGITREWVGKLERAQEEFSEYVLMKIEQIRRLPPEAKGEATAQNEESAADYGSAADNMRRDVNLHLQALLVAAGDDLARLGWIKEQMRRHVSPPEHWDENLKPRLAALVTSALKGTKSPTGKAPPSDSP